MTSLLKQRIDEYHLNYLRPVGEKVIEYYFRQFREVNGMDSITSFEAIICHEDDPKFWDDVVKLSECDHELLATEIGVIMTFPRTDECRVKWSGK